MRSQRAVVGSQAMSCSGSMTCRGETTSEALASNETGAGVVVRDARPMRVSSERAPYVTGPSTPGRVPVPIQAKRSIRWPLAPSSVMGSVTSSR